MGAQVQERTNVLLLGDNVSDVNMAKGLDHHNVLRVGFLNDKEERLEQYKQAYDVVLLGMVTSRLPETFWTRLSAAQSRRRRAQAHSRGVFALFVTARTQALAFDALFA